MKTLFCYWTAFLLIGATAAWAQSAGRTGVEALRLKVPASQDESDAATTEADDETRAAVRAAAEDVLLRRGNPPFAALISNDPIKAAELRGRFEQVRDLQRLRQENDLLMNNKAVFLNEIIRLQTQIGTLTLQNEEARLKLGQLRQIIDLVMIDLNKTRATIEDAPAREAPPPMPTAAATVGAAPAAAEKAAAAPAPTSKKSR